MKVNAQYNVAAPGSLPVRIAEYQRKKMFEEFMQRMDIAPGDTILDVGVTSDRSYDHSNYLEAWYADKTVITAAGIDDASFLESTYPGMKFVQADGRALPFKDKSFDFVHSSAVLEHVGNTANQGRFVCEAWRVARKGIFITTPNRWFPVEFHTVLPLLHWLPPAMFRRCLRAMGKQFFATEENLHLLGGGDLRALASSVGVSDCDVTSVSLLGWPTNLILIGRVPAR